MLAVRTKLSRARVLYTADVPDELHYGYLHAQTDAEVRDVMLASILRGGYHLLYPSVAKTARNQHTVNITQDLIDSFFILQVFRLNPFDHRRDAVLVSAVSDSFRDREICVMEFDVFTDYCDLHFRAAGFDA